MLKLACISRNAADQGFRIGHEPTEHPWQGEQDRQQERTEARHGPETWILDRGQRLNQADYNSDSEQHA